jgi:hypothetical protein
MAMIGQDTEFFCFDTVKGHCVPAHSLGIDKKKTSVDYYGSYFRDGYAIEINSPASSCRAGIWENLARVVAKVKYVLPKHIKLITDPVTNIDLEELKSAPDDLKILGCNPTFDAYAQREKSVNVDPMTLPFRTTGAHMHYSFNASENYELGDLGLFAKYCDLVIGLPFTIIYGDDKEFKRRSLYGTAGEFRSQKYEKDYMGKPITGFEYRVLSSRLYHHPAVFGLFYGIFKYLLEQRRSLIAAGWNEKLDEPLQRAINTGVGAVELLQEFDSAMKIYAKKDIEGMNGLGYIPKDWAAAILKMRDMRQTNAILDKFQVWEGQLQAHWGWSECNDHNVIPAEERRTDFSGKRKSGPRTSTVCHVPLYKEEPWLL